MNCAILHVISRFERIVETGEIPQSTINVLIRYKNKFEQRGAASSPSNMGDGGQFAFLNCPFGPPRIAMSGNISFPGQVRMDNIPKVHT